MTSATERVRTPCLQGVEWRVESGEWRTHDEQSAAARQLLCEMLGKTVIVVHDSQGAPYLPESPNLHISISHCRTAVAVAFSNTGPVGIDIESRRHINPSLIERVCTPDEFDAIQHSEDPEMAFLQLWTRKEAVLKCHGTGIQGFGSMVNALSAKDCEVNEIVCDLPDTVAALAFATAG